MYPSDFSSLLPVHEEIRPLTTLTVTQIFTDIWYVFDARKLTSPNKSKSHYTSLCHDLSYNISLDFTNGYIGDQW